MPDCEAKDCGDDGCGGVCGGCGEGEECTDGACVSGVTDPGDGTTPVVDPGNIGEGTGSTDGTDPTGRVEGGGEGGQSTEGGCQGGGGAPRLPWPLALLALALLLKAERRRSSE